jgi:protease I
LLAYLDKGDKVDVDATFDSNLISSRKPDDLAAFNSKLIAQLSKRGGAKAAGAARSAH